MELIKSQEPVGYIVGNVETQRFSFVTEPSICPPRLEYLVVRNIPTSEGGQKRVDVLAQVSKLQVASQILGDELTYEEARAILEGLHPRPKIIGTAEVLGYLAEDGTVKLPRYAPLPGQPVYLASDDFLRRFFSEDIPLGITIGSLINREGVGVKLNPNGLRRHLAIIAQTGAGKSYLAGLILENLIKLGATVLVFDPNSDYVMMRFTPERRRTSFADFVDIYRVPGQKERRYSDEAIGGSKEYTLRFHTLEDEDIFEIAGISESWTRITGAISKFLNSLRKRSPYFTVEDLMEAMERVGEQVEASPLDELPEGIEEEDLEAISQRTLASAPSPGKGKERISPEDVRRAMPYVKRLASLPIWGDKDLPIDEILSPQKLSVVDLAGLQQRAMEIIVDRTLREVWERATTGRLPRPLFIFLEEAHNFVPGGRGKSSRCAEIINRIASEGRKFRVFLVVITQRPYKINQDTLSQCGSQIIMKLTNPEDQRAVREASENLSESLLSDLPGLNKGEAVVLGELTRVPVMIKVGKREAEEGGADIDLVKELEIARSESKIERSKMEVELQDVEW